MFPNSLSYEISQCIWLQFLADLTWTLASVKSAAIFYEEDTVDMDGKDLNEGDELREWLTSVFVQWNIKVLIHTWKITQGGHPKFDTALQHCMMLSVINHKT